MIGIRWFPYVAILNSEDFEADLTMLRTTQKSLYLRMMISFLPGPLETMVIGTPISCSMASM